MPEDLDVHVSSGDYLLDGADVAKLRAFLAETALWCGTRADKKAWWDAAREILYRRVRKA